MKRGYLSWIILLFTSAAVLLAVRNDNFKIEKTDGIEDIIIENNTDPAYAIYARYPQFNNLESNRAQIEINKLLKDLVYKQIADFKNIPHNTNSYADKLKFMLFISYTSDPINTPIISVPIEVSIFNGKFRSQTYNLALNYDVLEHKQLTLNDLFKPSSDYLQILSDIASRDLKKQFQDPSYWQLIEQGTKPKEENFNLFSLNSDSLFLYFNPPQVAPAKERTRVVRIYYKNIRNLFKDQYAVKS